MLCNICKCPSCSTGCYNSKQRCRQFKHDGWTSGVCVCVFCPLMTDKWKLMFILQTPGVWVAQARMQMWNLSVSVSVCLCVISIKSSQSNFTDNHIRIMVNCWIEIWMYAGMFAFLQSNQKTIQLTNESFKSIKPFKLVVLWNFVFLHYCREHKIVLT